MTAVLSPPIGILAGNGSLPGEIARALHASGHPVVIVAIDQEFDDDLSVFPVHRLGIGQIGAILKAFRQAKCRELVIVGGVSRPDLGRMKLDLGTFTNFPAAIKLVFSGGDDGVLRLVVRFFETKGFTVISPADLAPALVVGAGSMTRAVPDAGDTADILLGSSVVKALGAYDIGQAVIVAGGQLLAVEAAEGTDRMLLRAGAKSVRGVAQGSAIGTRRGVLVKRPKPGQEMRIDLPTIGPATVVRAEQAGLVGIAVLAGLTLCAQRDRLVANANSANLFVYGFTEGSEPSRAPSGQSLAIVPAIGLSKRHPSQRNVADAQMGAAALASIQSLTREGAAVVNRGHILGLEPAGDITDLFARSKRLQPWGLGRWRGPSSMAVLAEETPLTTGVIAAAVAADLVGIALMANREPGPDLIEAANAAKLVLLRLPMPDRPQAKRMG